MFVVKLFFKRKNHEHVIHRALDGVNAPSAPGPELGRNVIGQRNSSREFAQGFGKTQIEGRRIDDADKVRIPALDFSQCLVKYFFVREIFFEDIPESQGRHRGHVVQQADAGFGHLRPAESANLKIRPQRAQMQNELGAVMIA